jgi:hypothetical protein
MAVAVVAALGICTDPAFFVTTAVLRRLLKAADAALERKIPGCTACVVSRP